MCKLDYIRDDQVLWKNKEKVEHDQEKKECYFRGRSLEHF